MGRGKGREGKGRLGRRGEIIYLFLFIIMRDSLGKKAGVGEFVPRVCGRRNKIFAYFGVGKKRKEKKEKMWGSTVGSRGGGGGKEKKKEEKPHPCLTPPKNI